MNVNAVWDNKKRKEKKGQSSVVGKERWGSFDGLGQYSTLVADALLQLNITKGSRNSLLKGVAESSSWEVEQLT